VVRLSGLRPDVRERAQWCLEVAAYFGVPVTVTSTLRSSQEQGALYSRYLAGKSEFPAAPPGSSKHEHGLAWDSWVPPEYRDWWVAVRRYVGFRVPDSDWIHAEV
jgi:LAS superfamily LD-carboxypeptidase LdcB